LFTREAPERFFRIEQLGIALGTLALRGNSHDHAFRWPKAEHHCWLSSRGYNIAFAAVRERPLDVKDCPIG
jgi:hypothetical protein